MKLIVCVMVGLVLCASPALAKDVTLAWDPVEGAKGYFVKMVTGCPPDWSKAETRKVTGDGVEYTWEGASDTGYVFFRAGAFNESGIAVQFNAGVWICEDCRLTEPPAGLGVK